METVRVLTTGGTIATRTDGNGNTIARASGADLVAGLVVDGVRIEVEDVFRLGSFRMTFQRIHELALRVERSLQDPDVSGVVVTHGTDTLEETALFLDLFLDPGCPVVITGAQRAADAPDSDGPRNLADSVRVAAAPSSRGLGALVVFDGSVFPAIGTQKIRTLESTAFGSSSGSLGWVQGCSVHLTSRLEPRPRLDLASFAPHRARVDIVPCYPDADDTALRALVAAGARGVVLEATGAGNANPVICSAVEEVTAAGVVVATSTRVASGPVSPIYGDGGGADLLRAGAVPTGLLRPAQARVLLAALLGVGFDPGTARERLVRYVNG